MLGIIIGVISVLLELFLLWVLLNKIKRYRNLTIKDTIVYPLLVVLTLVVLTLSRLLYIEIDFFDAVKASFTDSLNIVKLTLNKELVGILTENSIPLLVAYYGTYVISFVALSSLAIYCLDIMVRNVFRLLKSVFKGKEVIIIFGYNSDAKKMMKNFKDDKVRMTCILDSGVINKYVEEKTYLDRLGIAYLETPYREKEDYVKAIHRVIKWKGKKYTVITFFEDDKKNDEFSTAIINYLNNPKLNKGNTRFIMNVDSIQEEFIQKKFHNEEGVDILKGKLRTYNKYDLNSYLFNKEHTYSKHLNFLNTDEFKFINEDCTLGDVDIHVYFVGFGKVNQPLLRDALVNNQFVKKVKKSDGYVLEPYEIQVDVFDENKMVKAFGLSNGLFKYHRDGYDEKEYLPLPHDYYSNIKFHKEINIEETNFINTIYDDIKQRIYANKRKQVSFFYISLASDMYNTLIADNIRKHIASIKDSYSFFFVRKERLTKDDKQDDYYTYMGNDNMLFTPKNVLLDRIYFSAKQEHAFYLRKWQEANIEEEWSKLPRVKQQSNLYAILGLYFKKDLLNCNQNDYQSKYNPNGLKPVSEDDIDRLVKPHKSFDPYDVLTFSEHERWNAFELSQGVLPMKKEMFLALNENTKEGEEAINKSSDWNYHLCITTQQGLVDYYNLFKEHKYGGANVIAYDSDLMDHFIAHEKVLSEDK